jgi:hypothetical protein
MRRLLTVALAAVLAVLVAGCGREPRDQVQRSIEQLASISAEGALMADDLARARTKTTFIRVHGEELSSQAEHEAEKLNDAPVAPDLHGPVQTAITLSSDIGSAIDDLRVSPQDREQARQSRNKLKRLAKRASDLADSL